MSNSRIGLGVFGGDLSKKNTSHLDTIPRPARARKWNRAFTHPQFKNIISKCESCKSFRAGDVATRPISKESCGATGIKFSSLHKYGQIVCVKGMTQIDIIKSCPCKDCLIKQMCSNMCIDFKKYYLPIFSAKETSGIYQYFLIPYFYTNPNERTVGPKKF